MDAINSKRNRNGNQIRVIVATDAVLTGASFMNLRQIHVAETWWNVGRIEQTVGRGFRRNSHVALRPEEQNVVVFQHRIVLPKGRANKKVKKILGKFFKRQEEKRQAGEATVKALRDVAVDCSTQKNRSSSDYVAAVQRAHPTVRGVFGQLRAPRAAEDSVQIDCDEDVSEMLVESVARRRDGGYGGGGQRRPCSGCTRRPRCRSCARSRS